MKNPALQDQGLTLDAGLAKARREAAPLATSLSWLAEWHADHAVPLNDPGARAGADDARGPDWPALLDSLERAGERAAERGEAAARVVASGIQRHPVVGGLAAFGLGFALAALLVRAGRSQPPG